MLISLALAILYVFLDQKYRNDERYPIGDLLLTFIWTIFWIAGSFRLGARRFEPSLSDVDGRRRSLGSRLQRRAEMRRNRL